MPQHRDHVVGRDDAGDPAVLVHDRERDEVVFVEERGDLVLRRVRRAGRRTARSAPTARTAGDEMAILTSGTQPASQLRRRRVR